MNCKHIFFLEINIYKDAKRFLLLQLEKHIHLYHDFLSFKNIHCLKNIIGHHY